MVAVRGWIHTSDRSTAARRRGRRALRFRLVQRKLAGWRVSTLCLRRKPSKTRRNLCKGKKAALVLGFFASARRSYMRVCRRVFGIRAGPILRRAPQKPRSFRLQLLGFKRTSKVAIGYRVMKRSETTAVEPLEVAGEPVTAERFQRGPRRAARHSTAASDNAGVGSERAPVSKGCVHKGKMGVSSTLASG
jgi:hypothetical protein